MNNLSQKTTCTPLTSVLHLQGNGKPEGTEQGVGGGVDGSNLEAQHNRGGEAARVR